MDSEGLNSGTDGLGGGGSGKPAESRRSGGSARSCPPYNPGLQEMVKWQNLETMLLRRVKDRLNSQHRRAGPERRHVAGLR